jgi:Ser/Thr protein kinase RdoA (MazF antagonist)
MPVSTPSTKSIAYVIAHYPLGRLVGARRPKHGYVNDNWIITTEKAAFLLKHFDRSLAQPERIRDRHHVLRWLHSRGFPTPCLAITNSGDTLLELGPECYELQEYVPGSPYDHSNAEHLREAGRVLGRYHALVAGCRTRESKATQLLYHPSRVRLHLAALQTFAHRKGNTVAAALVSHLDDLSQRLSTAFSESARWMRVIIHGDYYAENLLFDDQRIAAVVDFDKACWQPRVFAAIRPGRIRSLVYPDILSWDALGRFATSYAHCLQLSVSEAEALPAIVATVWLQVSLGHLRETQSDERLLETLGELLILAQWAEDNRDRIRRTFRP